MQKRSAASWRSHWYLTHTGRVTFNSARSKTVYLITKQDISLLQEWTMWHKWVWSSVFKKKPEQNERESVICISALYMKHKDCIRVTERQTFCWKMHNNNLSPRVKSLYLSQIIVNVHNVINRKLCERRSVPQQDFLSAAFKCESGVSLSVQRAVSHAKTNNTCCQWFLPPEAALVLYNDSRTILNTTPANRCNTENYRMDFCR